MSSLIYFIYFLSRYASCFAQFVAPPDFYQFGDVLSDVGNTLALISSTLPANNFPYGTDFVGAPDGRWSDGQLIIDYFASEYYQVLDHVLPYPSQNSDGSDFYGLDFAYAGSTALNTSTLSKYSIRSAWIPSLEDQIHNFTALVNKYCSGMEYASCAWVQHPIAIFGPIGSTDIIYAYTQNTPLEQIMSLISSMVNVIVQGITDLLKVKIRKIVVPLNFPLGCFPSIITHCNFVVKDEYGCVEVVNNFSIYQNQLLVSALKNLSQVADYSQTTILTVDYYNLLLNYISNPSKYGFENSTILEPCCGNGVFNFSSEFCGLGGTYCANPNVYIHWDGISLTSRVYGLAYQALKAAIDNPAIGG